jgi:hypothetical protein
MGGVWAHPIKLLDVYRFALKKGGAASEKVLVRPY